MRVPGQSTCLQERHPAAPSYPAHIFALSARLLQQETSLTQPPMQIIPPHAPAFSVHLVAIQCMSSQLVHGAEGLLDSPSPDFPRAWAEVFLPLTGTLTPSPSKREQGFIFYTVAPRFGPNQVQDRLPLLFP